MFLPTRSTVPLCHIPHIVLVSSYIQMRWSHAPGVIAGMKHEEAFWKCSEGGLSSIAMSANPFLRSVPEVAIACWRSHTFPFPALARFLRPLSKLLFSKLSNSHLPSNSPARRRRGTLGITGTPHHAELVLSVTRLARGLPLFIAPACMECSCPSTLGTPGPATPRSPMTLAPKMAHLVLLLKHGE